MLAFFYDSYTLVFPSDKGGIKDKIIQKYNHEETIDEVSEKVKRTSAKAVYSWTGSGFVKE